jgi:hypothetical protein
MLREIVPQLHECGSRPFDGLMSLSDWTIANPESAGLPSEPLRELVEWLDGFGQANIHSVLVVRHGKLSFEHYRAGEDESVINWFLQYSDLRTPEKERISLRHLLTMSAGLEWNEYVPFSDPKNSAMRMLESADRCRYALEQPVVAPGGQIWNWYFASGGYHC